MASLTAAVRALSRICGEVLGGPAEMETAAAAFAASSAVAI